MSRRYAYITLAILAWIFVLGIADEIIRPGFTLIPPQFTTIAATVLAGVAIGAILVGIRDQNGGSQQATTRSHLDDQDDTQE